jgi:hypothetical protein
MKEWKHPVIRTSADKDGTRIGTKASLPLRRGFFCEANVVKWLGQPLWISYECLAFVLIRISVWPYMGLQRWLQYGMDEQQWSRHDEHSRTSQQMLIDVTQCDRSLFCCCKFPWCLVSSHWWSSLISENVLRFLPLKITVPNKCNLNSICWLRNFGLFLHF